MLPVSFAALAIALCCLCEGLGGVGDCGTAFVQTRSVTSGILSSTEWTEPLSLHDDEHEHANPSMFGLLDVNSSVRALISTIGAGDAFGEGHTSYIYIFLGIIVCVVFFFLAASFYRFTHSIADDSHKAPTIDLMRSRSRETMDLLRAESRQHLLSPEFRNSCLSRFDAADRDGNGKIDLAELRKVSLWDLNDEQRAKIEKEDLFKKAFKECDADHDESIDRDEFVVVMQFIKAHAELGEEPREDPILDLMRTKSEQKMQSLREESRQQLLSPEFQNSCLSRFDAADTDGNGKLDLAELKAVVMFGLTVEQIEKVKQEDLFKKAFDKCDADKNEFIDRDEFVHVLRYVTAHAMDDE